jgi:hypothetical protein
LYRSNDIRAKIELPRCRQYKPTNFLAVRPRNWNQIIDKDFDENNWAGLRASSGRQSHPGDDNDNDKSEGEENTEGGEKGMGKVKGTKDGKGKGNGMGTENDKRKGIDKLFGADLDTEG